MRKYCPRCGGSEFSVIVHVTQNWRVDGDGDFLQCDTNCIDVTHRPNDEDVWTCADCGYEASGETFNAVKPTDKPKMLNFFKQMFQPSAANYGAVPIQAYCNYWQNTNRCLNNADNCPLAHMLQDLNYTPACQPKETPDEN